MDLSMKSLNSKDDNSRVKDSLKSGEDENKALDLRKRSSNPTRRSSDSDETRRIPNDPVSVKRIVIYNKSNEHSGRSSIVRSGNVQSSAGGLKGPRNSPKSKKLLTEQQKASNRDVVRAIKKQKLRMKLKERNKGRNVDKDRSDDGITKAKRLFHENVSKYIMPLESEKGLYITGATLLAMKGFVSYEEYKNHSYKKNIRSDVLGKKFYLTDVLGALRGMTRLKLVHSLNRLPSATMFKRMKEEDKELESQGFKFVSDSDNSDSRHLDDDSLSDIRDFDEPSDAETTSSHRSIESSESLTVNIPVSEPKAPSIRITDESDGKKRAPAKVGLQRKSSDMKVKSKTSKTEEEVGENENTLPEELHQCGTCGISITSLQHLDRHLERCRGIKKKTGCEKPMSRRNSCVNNSNQNSTGNLYVCDTEDGEIIEGWGPTMGAIPPGPTCPRCSFEIPTLYDLPLHQRHHTGLEEITCPVCTFSTMSTQVYLVHAEEHCS